MVILAYDSSKIGPQNAKDKCPQEA